MQPGGLSDTVEVSIPGHTKRISKKANHAISDVNYWVLGYIAGISAKEPSKLFHRIVRLLRLPYSPSECWKSREREDQMTMNY